MTFRDRRDRALRAAGWFAALAAAVTAGASTDAQQGMDSAPPGAPGEMSVRPLDLSAGIDDATLARLLSDRLSQRAAADTFSGVVLLARDGRIVFHEAFGDADRSKGRAATTDTAFDIGSITKLITRAAVAQLLQQERLALTGRIADYLPNYPNKPVADAVTIGQLLDHSSGLGDIFNERWMAADKGQYVAPGDFFELFADQPLRFEPGTSRAYSNAGYVVLGAIVEAVSGMPYAEYVEKNIFAPAGMRRSGFELRDGNNEKHAIGYAPLGDNGELVANIGMLPVAGCPAGSSMHTAEDLLRFDTALRDGTLLDPEWTAWLFRAAEPLPGARYPIGVAGGAPGVSAGLESDGRIVSIVLANLDPPTGDALALELFTVLQDSAPVP